MCDYLFPKHMGEHSKTQGWEVLIMGI
uniref:Uncharacterized protein n=1 Tax=Arundo donax TaxID=35708 RepID=A0A0A8ZM83_ARUDO